VSATSILINVGAATAGAVRELDNVNNALGRQMTATEKARGAWKKVGAAMAGAVAGAAIVDYFSEAAKAASEDAAEVAKLETVIKNNTKATAAQIEATNGWVDSMQLATGIADTELRASLEKLVVTTGNVGKAQELAGLAADVAAQRNISLSSATKIVEKAYNGNTTALLKQNPQWDKNKDGILSAKEALDGLGKSSKGAAEAGADPWKQIQIIFDELKESLGAFILPLLDRVKEWLKDPGNIESLKQTFSDLADKAKEFGEKAAGAIGWLRDNSGTVQAFATVLGVLAAAIVAVNVAMTAWAVIEGIVQGVTIALAIANVFLGTSFSLALGPVLLIIAAIAAVVAIAIVLWRNWDTITKWIGQAWEWLKVRAIAVFNGIREWVARTWESISAKATETWNNITSWLSGVWEGIRNTAVGAFNGLKSAVSTAWDNIKAAVSWRVNSLIEMVKALPGGILSALGNLNSLLFNKGKDLIDGLINGIKSMAGAIVRAILNLLPGPVRNLVSGALGFSAPAGGTAVGRSFSPRSVTFNLYGDPVANERAIKRALEGYDVSMGRSPGQRLARAW
jgi:hypothetical protein